MATSVNSSHIQTLLAFTLIALTCYIVWDRLSMSEIQLKRATIVVWVLIGLALVIAFPPLSSYIGTAYLLYIIGISICRKGLKASAKQLSESIPRKLRVAIAIYLAIVIILSALLVIPAI